MIISLSKRVWLRVIGSAGLALSGCAQPSAAANPGAESSRLVLLPSAIAVLSASEQTTGLPSEVHFGGARGHSALFLRFPGAWRAQGQPLRAYLVLTPSPFGNVVTEPVRVQAWRASSAWAADDLHDWSDKPTLAPPYVNVGVTSSPPAEFRIDVSEWLRFAAEDPERDFGLALLSRAGAGVGLSVATGVSGGRAPRLEVYLR